MLLWVSLFMATFTISLQAQTNYQPGFIVTTNGDSIKGFINYRDWEQNPLTIQFRSKTDENIKEYGLSDLDAFGVAKQLFEKKTILVDKGTRKLEKLTLKEDSSKTIRQVFLRVLVKGKASLYLYADNEYGEHFFMEKDTIPLTELIYRVKLTENDVLQQELREELFRFRNQLRAPLFGTPNLAERLSDLKYEKKDLVNLFNDYNKLSGKISTYNFGIEKIKLEWVVVGGLTYNFLKFKGTDVFTELNAAKIKSSVNYVIGAALNITLPRTNGAWATYHEISYKPSIYNGRSILYNSDGNVSKDMDIHMTYNYLNFVNMMKYQLVLKNIAPYFGIGLTASVAVSSEQYQNTTKTLGSEVTHYKEPVLLSDKKGSFGIIGVLGISNKRFFVDVRAEETNAMSDIQSVNSTATCLYAVFGYKF